MSRKKSFFKRKIFSDYKFDSKLISKFINLLMVNGKKSLAQFILYKSLNIFFNKIKKYDIKTFEDLVNKIKPIVEVKSRKIGGSTYQIPVEIQSYRKNTLAIRWIISAAKKRSSNQPMFIKLSNEFLDILNNKGLSIKKRDEVHRSAELNKAFSHYRW